MSKPTKLRRRKPVVPCRVCGEPVTSASRRVLCSLACDKANKHSHDLSRSAKRSGTTSSQCEHPLPVQRGRIPKRCPSCRAAARAKHAALMSRSPEQVRNCRREAKRRRRQRQKDLGIRCPGGSARARAKRAGVPYQSVNPFSVFHRDGWKCRQCSTATPRELRGSCQPNAPELDHRIPISKGGAHSYDNCQLLCRQCNFEKSDRIMEAA